MKIKARRVCLILTLILSLAAIALFFNEYFARSSGKNYVRLKGYEKEENNSIDVLLLGSSDVFTAFSPGLFYEDTQITSYPYGVEAERICLWKKTLEKALETQTPKLIVVDVHGAVGNTLDEVDDNLKESATRYVYDSSMDSFSDLRDLEYIYNGKPYDLLSYAFPFVYYHGLQARYRTIIKENAMLDSIKFLPLKGVMSNSIKYQPEAAIKDVNACINSKIKVGKDYEKYLREFLDYCKEQRLEKILFINTPVIPETDDNITQIAMADYVGDIVTQYGYDFFNLQYSVDEIGIDYCNDYYNSTHQNIYGQYKMTKYIEKLIAEKYQLKPSELSDESKINWNYSAKSYELFYDYADERIKSQTVEELYDSPEFISYLTDNLGSEGLIK